MKELLVPFPKELFNSLDKKTQNKVYDVFNTLHYLAGGIPVCNSNGTLFSSNGESLIIRLELISLNQAINVSQDLEKMLDKEREDTRILELEKEVRELRKLKQSIQTIKSVIGE